MTQRQKLAASKIMENHGNISKTMREVGYRPATAKNPSNLTDSKGWQKLVQEKLSDDKLLSKHTELLDATKIITSHTEPDREYPDYPTQVKALDLGYKVKGKYADTIVNQQFVGSMDIEFITNEGE